MDVPAIGSDTGGELAELRRRAYGPHPDIEDDPAALARLIELEAAQHRSNAPVEPMASPVAAPVAEPAGTAATVTATLTDDDPVPPPRHVPSAPTRRWGLIALAVGAAIALTGVLAAVAVTSDPPPDAVMRPTGDVPDIVLLRLLAGEGQPRPDDAPGASEMQIDLTTLRAFGTYLEVEVWSATNAFGSPCLIGVHRATDDVVARRCMPAGADLFMDMPWDVLHDDVVRRALPEGEVLRFFLRPDAVDVHVLVSTGVGR